jgi:hypothetical protein
MRARSNSAADGRTRGEQHDNNIAAGHLDGCPPSSSARPDWCSRKVAKTA